MQVIVLVTKKQTIYKIVNYVHCYEVGKKTQYGYYCLVIQEYSFFSNRFVKKDTLYKDIHKFDIERKTRLTKKQKKNKIRTILNKEIFKIKI